MNTKVRLLTGGLMAAILVVVFGFYFLKQHLVAERLAAYSPPPIPVTTLVANESNWVTHLEAVGEVTANDAVDVTPQLGGQVKSIHFQSGDTVTAGDLLVQLDDQLEQDELERDEAKVRLAQLDVDRYAKLVKEKSASQATYDRVFVTLQTNQAIAHTTRTKIDYMAISAPFSGRLGIRQANVGEFVRPGTAIVNLQDISVLFVDFSLSEIDLPKLETGLAVEVRSDAYPGKIYKATIAAISPQIDPNSRNVDVRARLDSADDQLAPGMYVEITVVTRESAAVVELPAVAVTYSLYGDLIYVIGDADESLDDSSSDKRFKIEQRAVEMLAERDSIVAVSKGVKAGDQVVTSNQHQLKASSVVTINNNVKLDPTAVTGQ
jgi:membrane fusion protein (multidrug efflux system)